MALKRKSVFNILGGLTASTLILFHPQPLTEDIVKRPSHYYLEQNFSRIDETQSYGLFLQLWNDRASTSKIIIEEARRVMEENKSRNYKLGEWDCALFTKEVYNRAIVRVMRSALQQIYPNKNYDIRVEIGSTTYEQWNSMKTVIAGLPKSKLLSTLSDENIGDLIFHRDVEGIVTNPTPTKKYGHVAIYSGNYNGVHYAIANTKRKCRSGVMELPLSRMFKAGRLDKGNEPTLFVARPVFEDVEVENKDNKITIATKSDYPIRIFVTFNK